jgi:hypothetical protein
MTPQGKINPRAFGLEKIPDHVRASARVTIEKENGDKVAIVEWDDPTFHIRYLVCGYRNGKWEAFARGWKGQYVRPAPQILADDTPVPDWILEKIEEHEREH